MAKSIFGGIKDIPTGELPKLTARFEQELGVKEPMAASLFPDSFGAEPPAMIEPPAAKTPAPSTLPIPKATGPEGAMNMSDEELPRNQVMGGPGADKTISAPAQGPQAAGLTTAPSAPVASAPG